MEINFRQGLNKEVTCNLTEWMDQQRILNKSGFEVKKSIVFENKTSIPHDF